MKIRTLVAFLIALSLLLMGCTPTAPLPQNSSVPPATTEPPIQTEPSILSEPSASTEWTVPINHDHDDPASRKAENFMVQCIDRGEMNQYYVSYQEPDGCLTQVVYLGVRDQPLMIHDGLIYYVYNDIYATVYAADFSGNVVSSIALDWLNPYYQYCINGYLLYCDDKYIYGAIDSHGGDAEYCFSVDFQLTEANELAAIPAKYRQMDYSMLLSDLVEVAQCGEDEAYVNSGYVRYDANGRIKAMSMYISILQNGEIRSGILLFQWYNQLKGYKDYSMNPWFNPAPESDGNLENAIPLKEFLNYMEKMEEDNIITANLPETEQYYHLYFQSDSQDQLPILPEAESHYITLSESGSKTVDQPDTLPKFYFQVAAQQYDPSADRPVNPSLTQIVYILLGND